MEMEENLDEIFDLKAILPEIYSFQQFSDFDNGSKIPDNKKQSISWNSCYAEEIICTKPSSSSAASTPQLISFDNSNLSSFSPANSSDVNYNNPNHEMSKDNFLTSQIINFLTSAKDDSGKNPATRTPLKAQEHLLAERKRRENLGQLFISLSKIVPGLKKLDKASLLEDAIDYLKALEERVRVLEEEEMKKSSADTSKYYSSSHKERSIDKSGITPEIQARISDKHVLIKIFCKKQMELMSTIQGATEKIHLNVIDIRVMPFGGASLDITILAETQGEFRGTVKDIVDKLHAVFLDPRIMKDRPFNWGVE